jgi:hypothetical protein
MIVISTLSQEKNATKPIIFWGGKATIGTAFLSFIHAANDIRNRATSYRGDICHYLRCKGVKQFKKAATKFLLLLLLQLDALGNYQWKDISPGKLGIFLMGSLKKIGEMKISGMIDLFILYHICQCALVCPGAFAAILKKWRPDGPLLKC